MGVPFGRALGSIFFSRLKKGYRLHRSRNRDSQTTCAQNFAHAGFVAKPLKNHKICAAYSKIPYFRKSILEKGHNEHKF